MEKSKIHCSDLSYAVLDTTCVCISNTTCIPDTLIDVSVNRNFKTSF